MSFVSSFLLLIIFKTQSVHTDGITFLDAELFKLIENSRLLEEILEEAESLLGIQICVTEHLFNLRPFYDKDAVFLFLHCIRKIRYEKLILREEFLLKDDWLCIECFKLVVDVP